MLSHQVPFNRAGTSLHRGGLAHIGLRRALPSEQRLPERRPSINGTPLILNLLTARAGGGLQNTLSLVRTLASQRPDLVHQTVAIVRGGTPIALECREAGMRTVQVADSYWGRLAIELRCRRHFARGSTCFAPFGAPMLAGSRHFLNVVGVAVSNLFYPEVPFWHEYPWHYRLKRHVVDAYRRWSIGQADYWVFETPILARRAVELARFPEARVGVVRMAPSTLVSPQAVHPEAVAGFERRLPKAFRMLFLCGANPNKRLHRLPAIARELIRAGRGNIAFITTFDPTNAWGKRVLSTAEAIGVGDLFVNLGPVAQSAVASLISCCDAMGTFSVLESFSNNFVEAWRMGKPLVVTDADWARDACGRGAIYVDPEAPRYTASVLASLASDAGWANSLAELGARQLATYPSAEGKLTTYLEHLDIAQELGPCPAKERGRIVWPSMGRTSRYTGR